MLDDTIYTPFYCREEIVLPSLISPYHKFKINNRNDLVHVRIHIHN